MFRQQLHDSYSRALTRGAILPLTVETESVSEGSLNHEISWLSSLSLKAMATAIQNGNPGQSNPFLPYDPELFVANISQKYVALLNKFPIADEQVMAVTKDYVSQLAPFDTDVFEACAFLLSQTEQGYILFNGGAAAGASQNHRHLHLVPDQTLPFESLFEAQCARFPNAGKPLRVPEFPFHHALVPMESQSEDRTAFAVQIEKAFNAAVDFCELASSDAEMAPFNLLATKRWLALFPRVLETCGESKVPVNALHFGGYAIVRDRDQIAAVKQTGLMRLLANVSLPID